MSNDVIIYNTDDGKAKIELHLDHGTVWLTQAELAELFQTSKQNISKHIKAIFVDGELIEEATVNYQLTVQNEGGRSIQRQLAYYNLDMILAIGYRVRSPRGVQFRQYASTVLKEYLIKGFAMDDERLKAEAKSFFATVQNKMHYAVHHHTASELIYHRVDSDKEFMGLTTFKGDLPTLKEAQVAKNYLSEKELRSLNQLVSGYLDFAERQAEREIVMTMKDWVAHVDNILSATGEDVLEGSGKISRVQMTEKVLTEYQKYTAQTLSQVEKDYLAEIKSIEEIARKGGENQ